MAASEGKKRKKRFGDAECRTIYLMMESGISNELIQERLRLRQEDWQKARTRIKRSRELSAAYLTGLTLEEIGKREGLTRERVRQIIKLTVDEDARERAAKARRRFRNVTRQLEIEAKLHSVGIDHESLINEYRRSYDITKVARKLKLEEGLVLEILRDANVVSGQYHPPRSPEPRYTDDQMISYLQLTAKHFDNDIITGGMYDQFREQQTLTPEIWPTRQLFGLRFGSWGEACEAAGLQMGKGRSEYTRRFTDSDCIEALTEFLRYCDHNRRHPSIGEYRTWVTTQVGHPSAATIRNRFSRSWREAVRRARLHLG